MVLGGYESGLGSGRVFRSPGLRLGPNFAYRIIVIIIIIIYIGDLNLCGCTYAPMFLASCTANGYGNFFKCIVYENVGIAHWIRYHALIYMWRL